MGQPDFDHIASTLRSPSVRAIALMGSYARGDAGEYSDVDIVRLTETDTGRGAETYLIGRHFVVVSDVGPSEVERWFTDPERVTACITGVRSARPLWDPDDSFAVVQARARSFVWDAAMQEKANVYASRQMVGWIEEVNKGLEGLKVGDEGRLLNARYGLCWGLTKVMRVQRGILISGDNRSYPEVAAAVGHDSEWARQSRAAFGIAGNLSLAQQVQAGPRLYVLTADLIAHALQPENKELVEEAVRRISTYLRESRDGAI